MAPEEALQEAQLILYPLELGGKTTGLRELMKHKELTYNDKGKSFE